MYADGIFCRNEKIYKITANNIKLISLRLITITTVTAIKRNLLRLNTTTMLIKRNNIFSYKLVLTSFRI